MSKHRLSSGNRILVADLTFLLLILCGLADIVTTAVALHLGAVEQNPLMYAVLSHAWGWPLVILLKLAALPYLVRWICIKGRNSPWLYFFTALGIHFIVVGGNLWVILNLV